MVPKFHGDFNTFSFLPLHLGNNNLEKLTYDFVVAFEGMTLY